jgi:hypothetical protein
MKLADAKHFGTDFCLFAYLRFNLPSQVDANFSLFVFLSPLLFVIVLFSPSAR